MYIGFEVIFFWTSISISFLGFLVIFIHLNRVSFRVIIIFNLEQ